MCCNYSTTFCSVLAFAWSFIPTERRNPSAGRRVSLFFRSRRERERARVAGRRETPGSGCRRFENRLRREQRSRKAVSGKHAQERDPSPGRSAGRRRVRMSEGLSFRAGCRMLLSLAREGEAGSPERLLSPVSELTHSLGSLNAFQSGDTPRRCLDLSGLSDGDAPIPAHSDQLLSPRGPPDSPAPSFPQKVTPDSEKNKKGHMKRLKSMLPRLLCSSPKVGSGGLSPGARGPSSPCFNNKENVQETRPDCEVAGLGSPISCGPPSSPVLMQSDEQDGFTMVLDESCGNPHMTSSMARLLSDPLMSQEVEVSWLQPQPPRGGSRRLVRSPSMPERLDRPVLKRAPAPPDPGPDPCPLAKRWRSTAPIHEEEEEEGDGRKRGRLLKKTLSLSDVETRGEPGDLGLIGDFSKVYALPTVTGRHQDLKYITPETMGALLRGEFSSLVERCLVVDCRYPYEFQGGHIRGALNLHDPDAAVQRLLRQPVAVRSPDRRVIVVLHCEFSSERAPRMCRLLRREDRSVNDYPVLHYPELYILKGGYRDFFPLNKELCEPQAYCPMNSEDHREELLRFRTHSRSWAGERRRREQISRLMKI
ncbi:M-phase inducer phosphatase 1-B [Lepisosteus oculatus]|uniref:M-phase inducer phosphatase 1-B n=1 Tax=Lepisosteus oculatus TaxID=7918 RepID=UPI0035F52522